MGKEEDVERVHLKYIYIYIIVIWLVYSAVLVSTVLQSESAMFIHISPLFWIFFPFMSPQSDE